MQDMNNTTRHSRLLLVAILILSGSGAWLSGELLKQHDNPWGQPATGLLASFCDATQRWGFTCDSATEGAWSNVRLPMLSLTAPRYVHLVTLDVPLTFGGLAYFVFIAIWFGFVGQPRAFGRRWFYVPMAVAAMGGVGSVFYLAIMALKIAPLCSACITIHGINFLMIAMIGWLCIPAIRTNKTIEPTSAVSYRPARITLTTREAIGAVAFSLVLVAGLWHYRSEHLALGEQWRKLVPYKRLVNQLRDDQSFLLREYYAQPAQTWADEDNKTGVETLPRMDVFIDYECPACACRSDRVIAKARTAFGKQLQVVIRQFPLCQSCNPIVQSEFHKHACLAAYAAEAARLQGGDDTFWRMHERLIHYPGALDRDNLCKIAEQLDLDMERFLKDLESEVVQQTVASHIAMGQQWNVYATPTLFINGRRVNQNFEGPSYWQALADDWSNRQETRLTSASVLGKEQVAANIVTTAKE